SSTSTPSLKTSKYKDPGDSDWLVNGFVLVSGESPDIYISGPEFPVLEGEAVTLECRAFNYSDLSNFTFQKYLRYSAKWVDIDNKFYYRCWYYNLNVSRIDGRLFLNINELYGWQSGPYRCISKNNDSDDIVSDEYSIPVSYLRDIYLESNGSWQPRISDVVYMKEGSDMSIKCTAQSSSEPEYEWTREPYSFILEGDTLVLDNIQEEDAGEYTCKAKSTDFYSLMKTKSFQLRVLSANSLTQTLSYEFPFASTLFYVLVPAMVLLLGILVVTIIFIHQKRRKNKKPQISLVYGEKFSPIYKGCIKPIERKDSDSQPLVA
uniref:Ig-like domain-containing protein n=1 Tax=Leptobrachium leishanense TaxID=445787 RepID=A0A8C5R9R7_9ANUR